jgi:hypothetical protein
MILFAQDWARYPNAIADTKTRNESYLKLALTYRGMGVKNHAFILALHHPELQGVDPYDENLTLEQQALIGLECKENPWYFFRECVRVPQQGSMEPVMLEANRGNIALWWCFFNHIFIILIQIRQTGKSLSADALKVYLMMIKCLHTLINLVTKDDELRRENIKRIKDIMGELPPYLDLRTRADAQNGEEVTVEVLENHLRTHVAQAVEKRAYNQGRGMTSPIYFNDEGPFQVNIDKALPAALAARTAAVTSARAAGTPYGTVLTTTAGKKDDREGAYVYAMVEESALWTESFFDCLNEEELEKVVMRASRGNVFQIHACFNHIQLGKSDEWLYRTMKEVKSVGEAADRDFFNVWTSGTSSSPFDSELAEAAKKSMRGENFVGISKPDGYVTRWYIPENQIEERMANSKFALGMDTSEASGNDDISLLLIDIETADVVAAGTYNETNLVPFAHWVASWFIKYPNITGIIERRSTGASLLDHLLWILPQHGIDPFKRLFNRVVNDHLEYPERFKEIDQPVHRRDPNINVRFKQHFGFATSGSGVTSRSELYSTTLVNALKRAAKKMYDPILINQTLGLIVTKNGRVDHQPGAHDDMVIGWLLGHWLITQATNLAFYGIDSRKVLQKAIPPKQYTRQELYVLHEQKKIREQLEQGYQRLINETDEYVCMSLERELKALSMKLIHEDASAVSFDEVIRQAREARKNRKRHTSLAKTESVFRDLNYANRSHQGEFADRPMSSNEIYGRWKR